MRFFATNRHNGKRYPAEGQHWPEHGWHIKIFDFAPDTWGRAESGIGPGPVIAQGWQKQIEQQGFQIPPLKEPENVRNQMLQKLAGSFQKPADPAAPPPAPPATESRIDWGKRLKALRIRRGELAESITRSLLEDCVPGGSAKGERHDTSGLDKKELAMGRKVEREHTKGAPNSAHAAEEIAIDHLTEPGHRKYYTKLLKAGLADELK